MKSYPFIVKTISDQRGNLSIVSSKIDVPFTIERIFYIWNASTNHSRGGHAHKVCWQAIIAIQGACTVYINDGVDCNEFKMESPDVCLVVPPELWVDLANFKEDCILLVLASHEYSEMDYIRNYDEYLRYVQQKV